MRIAGILNLTEDSFFDGGRFTSAPVERAEQLLAWGAAVVDVGAESTRPGSRSLSAEEEWSRLEAPLAALAARGLPVSVDTQKPEVARRALAHANVQAINDVNGLRAPGMVEAIAEAGRGAVIMHMRGTPRTMQEDTRYDDVVAEVRDFLAERIAVARAAGIERIQADPGIGFGKSAEGCAQLLARLPELRELGVPLYVGASRKSFIGAIAGVPDAQDRLPGSLAAVAAAWVGGAAVVRVHDVAETAQFLRVLESTCPC